jgi:hypothetical protein
MPRQSHMAGGRRASWRPRLAGLAIVLLLAAGGVAAYLVELHPAAARTSPPLPTGVRSSQAVGLVIEDSEPGTAHGQLLQLVGRGAEPAFISLSRAEAAQGSADWTADLMAGNAYIFIFLPTERCLTAVGPASDARLTLSHCDLAATQRWKRMTTVAKNDGHDFYQYASLANGACLTQNGVTAGQIFHATMATCSAAKPPDQLVAFWWQSV